jgi:hypothetical protein
VGLAELCPWADVIGTNVPNSPQAKIAIRLASLFNSSHPIRIVATPSDCKGFIVSSVTPLVFASEYFEHFHEPVSHLREVLETLNPLTLIIANTFSSPSIGHFDSYRVNGEELTGTQTSRVFNNVLREYGYLKISTKFWNNRPTYWKKTESKGQPKLF